MPLIACRDWDGAFGFLAKQGYTRIHARSGRTLEVVQDRVRANVDNRGRLTEDIEAALKYGRGLVRVYPAKDGAAPVLFSSEFHCAACDLRFREPVPNTFSFNSPVGACETCRGLLGLLLATSSSYRQQKPSGPHRPSARRTASPALSSAR